MGWYKPGTGKPVALSEFAPDKNVLEPGILLDAVGAQPTLAGFSPLANLVGLAPALAGRPVGSLYAYYSNESATLFAAIDNGAGVSWYGLDTALNTWVPLTGPTVNPAQPVRFAQFGDDVLTVGNFSAPDGVWIAPNKASNFVTIPGSPPNATVIVVAGLQAVAFVLDNWFSSAAGNVTDWTLSLATRADTGVLADAPGAVVAASPLFRSIVAFKKNVTYLGQQSFPEAWSWELISTQTGTWSQGCVIQLPDAVAFLGMDDFYMTTGYTPQRIPNNVKQWFFRTVNPLYIANTLGWYDEGNSILYWHFVSREAPDAPTCDRFVSYNTRAKRWCVGRLDVSSIPYLGMAATSLPNPGVPSIVIDGDFVPKGFTTFPSNMVLTTGYFGDPGRLSQLMRLLPVYNRAPCVQTLTPVCTDVLGQPDKVSEPATLGVDGWFYHRQYERYHKFILGMQGDCEITALIPEMREGGLWGYGVDVPCPETTLTVTSQVNPTDPVGNPEAPQLEVSGGNPEPVVVLGDSLPPQLTATGHPLGDLGGAHGLAAAPDLSSSATIQGSGGGCGAIEGVFANDLDCDGEIFESIITATGVNLPAMVTASAGVIEVLGEGGCNLSLKLSINEYAANLTKECPPGSGIFINANTAMRFLGNAKTDNGFSVCTDTIETGEGIAVNCNSQIINAAFADPGAGAPNVCQALVGDHCSLPVCDSVWDICGDSPGGSVTAYLTNHFGQGLKVDDRATNGLPDDCAPCVLFQGGEVTVTIVDALSQTLVLHIPVN